MNRRWKVLLWSLLGLTVYLTGESFLPASSQPTAQVGVALIHAYQATGSKMMESGGVHCRYTPTCSHYAEDAISYYGTVGGVVRAAGRLLRCSPWGGSGYDPAVEDHSAAYLAPQQETPEERKAREDAQKKAAEDLRKTAEEINKGMKDFQKNAPEALGKAGGACVGGCLGTLVAFTIHVGIMVVCLIFVWKDAKSRGDSNAVLWMILVFVFSWIGAIIYIVARPKGDLTPCPQCHQKRLPSLAKCPHCGTDAGAGASPPPKPA
jgi:putative membrane protein insertion efficiency factor